MSRPCRRGVGIPTAAPPAIGPPSASGTGAEPLVFDLFSCGAGQDRAADRYTALGASSEGTDTPQWMALYSSATGVGEFAQRHSHVIHAAMPEPVVHPPNPPTWPGTSRRRCGSPCRSCEEKETSYLSLPRQPLTARHYYLRLLPKERLPDVGIRHVSRCPPQYLSGSPEDLGKRPVFC